MRKPNAVLLAIFLVTVSSPTARAGAWLQAPGASYSKVSVVTSRTADRLDCRGSTAAAEPFGGTYSERRIFLYGEYGLVDWITLVGSFAGGTQEIVDASIPDYGTRSTGDLQLGARWGLRRTARTPLSLQTSISVPTYPATDPTLPVGRRAQFLPAGTGEVELELRVQAGFSFWPAPAYASAEAGTRIRGGPFGDQWLVGGEVGTSLDRFFAKVELRGIWPTGDPCATATAGSVSIHERSLRLAPEAAIRVAGEWWVGAGWSALLSGRSTLDNDQWVVSVAWVRPGANR